MSSKPSQAKHFLCCPGRVLGVRDEIQAKSCCAVRMLHPSWLCRHIVKLAALTWSKLDMLVMALLACLGGPLEFLMIPMLVLPAMVEDGGEHILDRAPPLSFFESVYEAKSLPC